jgi:hypothetical protein
MLPKLVRVVAGFSDCRAALTRKAARMTPMRRLGRGTRAGALTRMTIAVFALGCGPASAQMDESTMPAGSALGMTSPLGMVPSAGPAGPTGIPFGSTELNSGGTSPAPITPLSGTTSCYGSGTTYGLNGSGFPGSGITANPTGYGVSISGTGTKSGVYSIGTPLSNSIFDGGGTAGISAGSPISSASPPLNTGCVAVPPGATAASPGSASVLSTPGASGEVSLDGGAIPLGATQLNSAGVSPILPVAPPSMVAPTMVAPTMVAPAMPYSSGP